ncbi:MAG: tRNA (adenosine(37)-N6)-dimethylallyltransferase MiaA [Muribaculaceae bacterium]|nr:tRNA (adenosine(37)-N6)-dimethylallyltransferase MiaA [Muribaculaceae bacterium]
MESIAVTGPTASGKTGKAVALARALNGEIISADSRQVYVGMDLGTGKDLEEYGDVNYHLIDVAPAGEKYNLHRYVSDFNVAYADILNRGKLPIICGGTGMYLENALSGVRLPDVPADPALRERLEGKSLEELAEILSQKKTLHNTTDVDTCKRAIRAIEIQEYYERHPEEARQADRAIARPLDTIIFALDISRDDRRRRISARLDARLEAGMVDEVRRLLESGIPAADLIYYGLEYKFLTLYATGALSYSEMRDGLETAIHQFAKRQMTWLRGMERRGFRLHWLPYDMSDAEFVAEVSRIAGVGSPSQA